MAGARDVKEVEEVKEVKDRNRVGPVKNYADLLIYKQVYRLTLRVSAFSKTMPREEQFELGRQLRRSSRSVGANIVEGWTKRVSPAEFKRHLVIAAGEVAEYGGIAGCGIFKARIYDSQSLEGVEKTVGLGVLILYLLYFIYLLYLTYERSCK
jgi:hypothetical protein